MRLVANSLYKAARSKMQLGNVQMILHARAASSLMVPQQHPTVAAPMGSIVRQQLSATAAARQRSFASTSSTSLPWGSRGFAARAAAAAVQPPPSSNERKSAAVQAYGAEQIQVCDGGG